ncbi:MAG: hypothetical protein M3377_01795 [Actinomycetota bacterium]|nr:hypothetical protein [Actinomycetota bacterium]
MFDSRTETILREIDRDDLVTRLPWLGWGIRGVEVTQAVQYYESARHLTDPADRQPDNSVTLMANKPAWVRVYVRSGWFSGDIAGVTGTITVRRRELGFLWLNAGTLSPQAPGTVTARVSPTYPTERGTLGYTLNFIIPASMMCGNLRLDVHITSPSGWVSDRRVYIDATLRQTLRLAGIMVGYNGPTSTAPGAPTLTLAAPTLANLQTTSAWTLLTFPVQSVATYRTAGTVTWNLPLTDPPSCPGCCSPNWVALNTAVQSVRIADGNRTDVLYYGLMANGIPMGPIIGCNSGGVSTSSIGDGVTMAHELGHACGRPHSPCGTPGDPAYPAYEPYDPAGTPMASTGEYGIDIGNGAIKSPATFKDFMSYCGPRWVSLFVYGRLTNNPALDPVRVCVDRPWWRDEILYERQLIPEKWLPDPPPDPPWLERVVSPQPVISIIGVLHGPGELEIQSVFRLDAESEVSNGRALDMRAELVSGEGRVVASGTVYSLRSYAHGGCGCHDEGRDEAESYPRLIQAFVPDVEAGALLRIQRGGEAVWSRAASARKPRLGDASVKLRKDELHLSWSIEASGEQEPECWAQWSTDRGRSWHALSAGLRGGSAVLDARGLPSGRVAIRLLVSDGFHTAISRLLNVTVPRRPAEASILSPREGQTFASRSPMRLWAAATGAHGEPVPDDAARWVVDREEIATGFDSFVEAPKPGKHRATLTVKTREGSAETSVTFTTVELLEERDQD